MTGIQRLAMLEELCKQKDSTLAYLKQDLQSLESKVFSCSSFMIDVGMRLILRWTHSDV